MSHCMKSWYRVSFKISKITGSSTHLTKKKLIYFSLGSIKFDMNCVKSFHNGG